MNKDTSSKRIEQSIIAWAVYWPDQFYRIHDVEPRHFAHDGCRTVFDVMWTLYSKSGVGAIQTPTMIANAMVAEGWAEDSAFTFLTELNDYVPGNPEAIETLKQSLIHDSMKRSIAQAARELGDVAKADTMTTEELSAASLELVQNAVAVGSTVEIASMSEEMEREIDRQMDIESGKFHGSVSYPTGLDALDSIISGLRKGEMTVIASRPSVGKSALLGSIAYNLVAKQNLPGLIITMEMRREMYTARMLCLMSELNLFKAWNGLLGPRERQSYISHARDWVSKGHTLKIYDHGAVGAGKVAAMTRRLHHEAGVAWLGIDYLQLMEHHKQKGESDASAITRTSKAIKSLALSLNIPVIALAQINRDPEKRDNKRPRLSDIRESGALEQDADVVAMVYREAMYWDEEEKERHRDDKYHEAEIIIVKQRNGPLGTAKVAFYPDCAKYANMPDTTPGGHGYGW